MKDLTLEVAERCATACGYEETTRPVPNPFNPTKECWVLPKTDVIDSPLPIAAYYWFPRLWDRLHKADIDGVEITSCTLAAFVEVAPYGDAGTIVTVSNAHPCLALCEAIEALEGK